MRLLALSALLAIAGVAAADFTPVSVPELNGVKATVDLPAARHIKNVGGSDGAGLCVFTSVQHSADWQNVRTLDGFREWMRRRPGGGWPQKLDQMLRQFCAEKGVPVPPYVQHTGGDESFLALALRTDRMPAVTYAGRDDFYRGRVAHMVSLAHLDNTSAAIIDNNRPGVWLWMTRSEFLSRWRDFDGGWAVVLLPPPPPPHPAGVQVSGHGCICGDDCKCAAGTCPGKCPVVYGQCANGRCGVPSLPQSAVIRPQSPPVFTPAQKVQPSTLGPTPVGTPPGPDFVWQSLPGIGWGWVQKGVARPEAVGDESHLTGVVSGKIHASPRYSINGVEATRDDALRAVGGGSLADDSNKWHVAAVGDPAFLARFKADVANLPASAREKIHVQTYSPSDWAVAAFKLPAGVSVRKPSPGRTSEQAGVIGLDVYDAVKLLQLLNELLGFVKPAPQPGPAPAPQPVPAPTPTPAPTPEPAKPDNPLLAALLALLAFVAAFFLPKKAAAKK